MDGRGWSGSSAQRRRWSTIVASSMVSRDRSGSTSSSRSAANPRRVIVARSVPDPLTHRTRCSRPAWSSITPFAEVFPPPWLATERSAPKRFER